MQLSSTKSAVTIETPKRALYHESLILNESGFRCFPFQKKTFSHAADVTLLFNTKEIINSHYPACIHNVIPEITCFSIRFNLEFKMGRI